MIGYYSTALPGTGGLTCATNRGKHRGLAELLLRARRVQLDSECTKRPQWLLEVARTSQSLRSKSIPLRMLPAPFGSSQPPSIFKRKTRTSQFLLILHCSSISVLILWVISFPKSKQLSHPNIHISNEEPGSSTLQVPDAARPSPHPPSPRVAHSPQTRSWKSTECSPTRHE